MPTAGYSGKPLVTKIGVKERERWLLVNAPKGFEAALEPLPPGARLLRTTRGAPVDGAMFFAKERAMLERSVARVQAGIAEGGALWLAWPKKSSGVVSDITEDALREVVLPTGWVDVKVCAVDETYSGLKFLRRRKADAKKEPAAAARAARARVMAKVDVPAELLAALGEDAAAAAAFSKMPPSHQREYAGFVAEAKKPETRRRRAVQTVAFLRKGRRD